MEVESTNIRVENGELIVEIEFEDKYVPKFGDIVRGDLLEDDAYFKECQYMVSIYPDKKFSECNDFFDIVTLTRGKDIEYIAGSFVKSISKATESEEQELFDKLAKAGKRWNAKKKCLEDMETIVNSEYQKIIDKLIEAKKTKNTSYIDEAVYILTRLESEPELNESVRQFSSITKNMTKIYAAKNHDYGNSFEESLDEFGLAASVVRLGDKMNRIKSLIKKEARVKEESIKDTLLDMASYSVMTLMWLNKQQK